MWHWFLPISLENKILIETFRGKDEDDGELLVCIITSIVVLLGPTFCLMTIFEGTVLSLVAYLLGPIISLVILLRSSWVRQQVILMITAAVILFILFLIFCGVVYMIG